MRHLRLNQNGSAMSSLLALLPLILSIIATLGSIFLLIHHLQESSFICRSQVLDSQNQMLQKMNDLTSLNPAATELRTERLAAENEVVAAAGWPPAEAAAQAHFTSVVVRQTALSAVQHGLILSGNLEAQARQQKTRVQIQTLPGVHEATTQTPEMQVKPQQEDSPTPDYKPSDSIENDQTMQLTWTVHPLELLPQWIQNLFDQKDFALRSTCASRPRKPTSTTGDSQWTAILKKDKF